MVPRAGDGRVTALAAIAAAAWAYLLLFHGGFWRARETDTATAPAPAADMWPAVVAVVPARDEAAVIGYAITSLSRQIYPGSFRIVLVDDNSADDTARLARMAFERSLPGNGRHLEIIAGAPPPQGWTGKLHAVAQGIAAAPNAEWLWLTDADIAHAPDTLASLVARATVENLVLNSLMARLRTDSFAERAIVPAFVFFFQMLYPFSRVNSPFDPMAAAAGGCMLVRADALAAAGSIGAIRGALIDDCAMGRLLKRQGPIRLSLTHRSVSLRAYGWLDLWAMIARSAYAQLGYSPLRLAGALMAMAAIFVAPAILFWFAPRPASAIGGAAWLAMVIAMEPMLVYYRRSRLWGVLLPAISGFYLAATLASAVQHWRGRGGMWKGRAQATGMPA